MRTNKQTPSPQPPGIIAKDVDELVEEIHKDMTANKPLSPAECWAKFCFPHIRQEAERICGDLKMSHAEKNAVLSGQWHDYEKGREDLEWRVLLAKRILNGERLPRGWKTYLQALPANQALEPNITQPETPAEFNGELERIWLDFKRQMEPCQDVTIFDLFIHRAVSLSISEIVLESGLDLPPFWLEVRRRTDLALSC